MPKSSPRRGSREPVDGDLILAAPTFESGQAVFRGQLAQNVDVVMQIKTAARTIEYRSYWSDAPFVIRINASEKVPRSGGGLGAGIERAIKYYSAGKKSRTSETALTPLEGELAGKFEIRPKNSIELVDGFWVFGDVVKSDGTRSPVSMGLLPRKY